MNDLFDPKPPLRVNDPASYATALAEVEAPETPFFYDKWVGGNAAKPPVTCPHRLTYAVAGRVYCKACGRKVASVEEKSE